MTSKSDIDTGEQAVVFLCYLACLPPSIILRAWLLWLSLEWFLLPLGAPSLTGVQCYGVSFAMQAFIGEKLPKINQDETFIERCMKPFLILLAQVIYLVIAWSIQLFC